ncbi:zinc finger BED domain-containing protein 1-like [Rhizophagus clarus]|uniref:Zinc finger BED domain-containing protein 1-like n=1 Tax=Rhizophagus clarus TaxID=94130 RepID=A0A8H3QXQ5_9GLOM|nr:zinc finger BED domain-containing protein 1-like [Rhizophagus clarus]
MDSSTAENNQNNQNTTQKKRGGNDKQNYVPLEYYGFEITPHKESCQIELCNLLIKLDPAFDIPNVKLIEQTIQSAYNHTLLLIQKFVEDNAISISLITDMWTGRNRQRFLGITCPFLDKNFKIHEIIGFKRKNNVIVTDNRANMKKAIKEMNKIASNIKWQPCTAHTLQLVVGKGLNSVKLLVLRAKKLIDFFLRPKQSQRLEEIQKNSQNQVDMNTGQTSEYFLQVVANISTRWNLSYYAWNRLIKIKSYIQMLIVELVNNENDNDAKKDGKQLEKIILSSDEWELLQQLVIILSPFEEATNYLNGEKYITHSIMGPIIEQIKNLLYSSLSNSDSLFTPTSSPTSSTSPVIVFNTSEIYQEIENAADVFVMIKEVEILENDVENNNNEIRKNKIDLDKPMETKDLLNKVKKDLYNAICLYWDVLSEDYILSTILNPRVKLMNNKEKEEEIWCKKYEEYKENYLPTSLESPVESRTSSSTPSESSSIILNPIYKPKLFSIFEQNQPRASNEVEEYLNEDNISFIQYPFNWWLNKKNKYPILAKMARIHLSILATSTPSERLFSDARSLLSVKRSRMNSDFFNI